MTRYMIFDGRSFAKVETERLRDEVIKLIKRLRRRPVLAAIYNPEDKASRVYTEIKAKKAAELDVDFLKFQYSNLNNQIIINNQIQILNQNTNIDGIMVQTPLIDRETDRELCKLIDVKKDCDGLNPNSGIIPATVRAVMKILDTALQISNPKSQYSNNNQNSITKIQNDKICVIGKRGLVGGSILERIPGAVGMSASEIDINKLNQADVIISATGKEGLIKSEMIKDGVVCIDVGYPKGDFDPTCASKAGFFTPVPGGVGPITVCCLFENLIELKDGCSTDSRS